MTHDIRPSLQQILDAVLEVFNLTEREIRSYYRSKDLSQARAAVAVVSNLHFRYGVKTIGTFMRRDHSTVLYQVESGIDLLSTDEAFRMKVDRVKALLKETGRKPRVKPDAKVETTSALSPAVVSEIKRLRSMGWSHAGICKRFDLRADVVAPIIGVSLVERGA